MGYPTKPFDLNYMMKGSKSSNQQWDDFYDKMMDRCGDADENILRFIFNMLVSQGSMESHTIKKMFLEKYCYYFAIILKEAFPGGYLAWEKPLDHICYVYNNIGYDADGVVDFNEHVTELEPIQSLMGLLENFMQRGHNDDLRDEMEEFAYEKDISYAELCEAIYKNIPEDLRIKPKSLTIDAQRFFKAYKYKI